MKYCAFCGRENEDDAIRCWECGTGDFIYGDLLIRPEESSPPPVDEEPEDTEDDQTDE
jgi:hypothetical protein